MNNINVSGHGMIDYIVVIGFMLYAIWAAFTKPSRILWLIPAVLTFYFLIPVGGLLLSPRKLIPIIFIIATTLSGKRHYLAITSRMWQKYVFIVFSSSLVIGILYSLFFFNPQLISPYKRILIQYINYVNMLLLYLILRRECRDEKGLFIFFKAYIYTSVFLCLYGLYQYLAFQMGWPFRGIVYNAGRVGSAIDWENLIFRINSVANEPKRLSYMLMMGIILTLGVRYVYKGKVFSLLTTRLLVLLQFVCIFLTYSTSIYFIIALFWGIMATLSLQRKYRAQRIYLKLLLLVGILMLITLPFYIDRLLVLYELRVTGNIGWYKRQEDYGLEYMLAYPQHFLLGFGPGMYNFALANVFYGYAGIAGTFKLIMNSGLIKLLFNFGIVGCTMLFYPIYRIYKRRIKFISPLASHLALPITLFLLITSLLLDATAFYIAFWGALSGNILRK